MHVQCESCLQVCYIGAVSEATKAIAEGCHPRLILSVTLSPSCVHGDRHPVTPGPMSALDQSLAPCGITINGSRRTEVRLREHGWIMQCRTAYAKPISSNKLVFVPFCDPTKLPRHFDGGT